MNLKTCFSDYGKETYMHNFKPVDFVRAYCYKILPLVYDDSLSYYEVLCKVKKALNEVIENVNNLPAYIEQLIKEYITSGAIDEIIRELLGAYMLNVKYPPNGITPAVGDGTADDTEAIQGCIDYAQANGYGAVYFPSGKYLSQPITLKSNVGLYGNDRYSTSIICRGGASKALLSGNIHDVTIANLTLDGNDGFQVNEINCMEVTAKDLLLVNLICVDSSTHMVITGNGGHLQMDNIIYKFCVFNGLTISGNINVQASHLLFTEINVTRSRNVINIGTSNGTFDFTSNATAPVGMLITGNNNDVKAIINGAAKTFTDTGSNNNINIISKSISEKITGDKTVYTVNSLENVTGDKTIIAGDISETANNIIINVAQDMESDVKGNYNIISNSIDLNTKELVKYKIPKTLNKYFNYVPYMARNNTPYNALVFKDNSLVEDINYLKKHTTFDTFSLHRIGREYSTSMACQGSCWMNDRLVQFYTHNDKGIMHILDPYNGALYLEKDFPTIFHCNTATFVPSENSVYVTTLNAASGNYVHYVEMINMSNYTITRLNISSWFSWYIAYVSFDSSTNIMYFGDYNTHIGAVDWITKEIIYDKTIPLPKGYNLNGAQSFNVNNNLLYYYTLTGLFIFNAGDLTIFKTYIFPLWTDNLYYVGEVESLAFDGDNIIVSTACKYCAQSAGYMNQYFVHNNLSGAASEYRRTVFSLKDDYYFNLTYSSTPKWNPNGTTSNNGGEFCYCDELLLSLSCPFNSVNNVSIYNADPSPFIAYDLNNIKLHGIPKTGITFTLYNCKIDISNLDLISPTFYDSTVRIRPNCTASGLLTAYRTTIYDIGNALNNITQKTGNVTYFYNNIGGLIPLSASEYNLNVSKGGYLFTFENNVINNFVEISWYYNLQLIINENEYHFITLRNFILNQGHLIEPIIYNNLLYILRIDSIVNDGTLTLSFTITPPEGAATITVRAANLMAISLK